MGQRDVERARLGFDGPCPKVRKRLVQVRAFVKDSVYGFADRHAHVDPAGKVDDGETVNVSAGSDGLTINGVKAEAA